VKTPDGRAKHHAPTAPAQPEREVEGVLVLEKSGAQTLPPGGLNRAVGLGAAGDADQMGGKPRLA